MPILPELRQELHRGFVAADGDTDLQPQWQDAARQLFASAHVTPAGAALALQQIVAAPRLGRTLAEFHAKYDGAVGFAGALDWLDPEMVAAGKAPAAALNRYAAAGLTAAAMMMLTGFKPSPEHADMALQIGFGLDPTNTTVRRELLGPALFGVDLGLGEFELPPKLAPFEDLLRMTCLGTLREALVQLGEAAASRPSELAGARIDKVEPDTGCAGAAVALLGSGFGANPPAGVQVMFTGYAGGTVIAKVTSWSEGRIEVTVPAGVGDGPVGLVVPGSGPGTTFADAAGAFEGAATLCLGAGGARVVAGIGRLGQMGIDTHVVLTGAVFHGGPPRIVSFIGNGASSPVGVRPGSRLTLSWKVDNAASVTISASGARQLPRFKGPQAPSGSVTVGPLNGTVSWTGRYTLKATNACGTVSMVLDVAMKDRKALVLAGGGAKGAFEVGAVRCLYDVFGYDPELVCGTSAGALNAVKLAEGRSAIGGLEAMWLGLQGPPDMFVPTAPVGRILQNWKITGLFPGQLMELADMLGVQVSDGNWLSPDAQLAVGAAKNVLGNVTGAGLMFTVGDLIFRGAQIGMAIGKIVQDLLWLLQSGRSLFLFDPVRRLLDANVDPTKVRTSGLELRLALLSLDTGHTRYVDQRGRFTDDNSSVDLRDAAQASASIPVVYPPVTLPGGGHADGGVRDNVAVLAAELAGASSILAILPSPAAIAPGSYGAAPIPDLLGRAVDALFDESLQNDLAPYGGYRAPVKVIAPSFEVHSLFTVDPGLVRLNMDYGYLRAYDEMQPNDAIRARLRQLSDEITRMRLETWGPLEHQSEGQLMTHEIAGFASVGLQRHPDTFALAHVRDRKTRLRALFLERQTLAGSATANPRGIERVWQQWEGHRWLPTLVTPWDASYAHAGPALPAVPAPGPI